MSVRPLLQGVDLELYAMTYFHSPAALAAEASD